MHRSRRLSCALLVVSVLALSLGATSCGGGSGGGNSDLVLVGFNVPNIGGIPLNQPLMFTFSNTIDPSSITPDTLRVVGAFGPNFEATVVDGNLVALLPRSPNFEDYSDAGLLPNVRYTVSLAVYPAPATIRALDGRPLLDAESFQFDTVTAPEFIEPRRPVHHGLAPSQGGASDDEGCLNNPDNSLQTEKQFGSDLGARLLCLKNEGSPQIILDECEPTHNDQAVGTPSAVSPGFVNLPALRVRFNEPLDPITVVPYVPTDKFGLNVQLWLVGDTNKIPLPPRQIRTNKPLIVQSLDQTEIILVASNEDIDGNPVGGVPQGTYLINLTSAITDLPSLALDTAARPSPAIGGYQDIEDNVNGTGDVPPGYRMYFVTLIVPGSATSIIESFSNNLAEWGDQDSGSDQPGVYTYSDIGDPLDPNDDELVLRMLGSETPSLASPEHTLLSTQNGIGQSTTANWNGGFRMFGLPSLTVNTDLSDGAGVLRAVWLPFLGDGQDGDFRSPDASSLLTLSTDAGESNDNDGIYEFESFVLEASDTLFVSGSQPLVIFCRGDFTIDGTVQFVGEKGGPGLDTNGDPLYANLGSIPAGGPGGVAGPGGGEGGSGANPLAGGTGRGSVGEAFVTLFKEGVVVGGDGGYIDPSGGGGGGMAIAGDAGTIDDGTVTDNGGLVAGDPFLASLLSEFAPDRSYSPNANGSGGTGGGGGGINDQNGNGTPENGDDGGGGGGGGAGGIYVIAGGEVTINGTLVATGGEGGDTFALADQVIDLGDDGAPGGSGGDADSVTGIVSGATPSGAGGPGGGGSGGTVFFMGREGVTIGTTASINAEGGAGGQAGDVDLVGGNGSEGYVLLASMNSATIDIVAGSTISPAPQTNDYRPTVNLASAGQSEWVDLFTPTGVFQRFSWASNFATLQGLGLVQGTDFDAWLEVQGADTLDPIPADGPTLGPPTATTGLTEWTVVNSNVSSENAVDYDGTTSPIDGKRYFRWRWRFNISDTYPGETEELPSVESLTIEFER